MVSMMRKYELPSGDCFKPESIEAYYQHACALYEQEKYQECIDFVNYDVNQNEKLDLTNPRVADIGYIQAN